MIVLLSTLLFSKSGCWLELCYIYLHYLSFEMSSLNLCTGRPPTGVMIPDAV